MLRSQIRAWLKAGIMDNLEDQSSEVSELGTPQGGIISPLLMNIALHGLENVVLKEFGRHKVKVIRYADDFIITAKRYGEVIKAKALVEEFLKPVGLRLSDKKTSIRHSRQRFQSNSPGVEFLGFYFRNIKCSPHRGVKNTRGKNMPFKLITRPSKKSVANHKGKLKALLIKYKNAPLDKVIERLSSTIRGWTDYHSITQCTKTFSAIDGWWWKTL